MNVTHYEAGVTYIEDEEGYRVVAGCGAVLYSDNEISNDWTTSDLYEVDCQKCRDVYSLEFLALVP